MRNEGPFIVEWVCWYRMLGFDSLVVTNDCTDHSVALLEAFAKAGWLAHQGHAPPDGEPPKRSAHRAIRAHPATAATDWLLICDADELLVLHQDDTIQSYLARFPAPAMGIGFHWRCFGSGGETRWRDQPTHRLFFTGPPAGHKVNHLFKSMFRQPLAFEIYGPHSPRHYNGGAWGTGAAKWVDASGRKVPSFDPNAAPVKGTHASRIDHSLAQMNHYILRSAESFGLKRGTLSSTASTDRYTDAFFARFDLTDERDESALRFRDAFDRTRAAALRLPEVRRLHYLCCADYAARLAVKAGADPERDRRVLRFRAKALT